MHSPFPLQAAQAYDRAKVLQDGPVEEQLNFSIVEYAEELMKYDMRLASQCGKSSAWQSFTALPCAAKKQIKGVTETVAAPREMPVSKVQVESYAPLPPPA